MYIVILNSIHFINIFVWFTSVRMYIVILQNVLTLVQIVHSPISKALIYNLTLIYNKYNALISEYNFIWSLKITNNHDKER